MLARSRVTLFPYTTLFRLSEERRVGKECMTPHQKYQVVLILKEAINNAVKYSECTTLQISYKQEIKKNTFKITDNGIGFDVPSATFGNGLKNMQTRATNINGDIHIMSDKKNGTEITLTIVS